MATSKIEIIKRAASITGNGGLVSIDDDAEVARLTDEHYEAIVEEFLTQHGWKFARRAEACQLTTIVPERPWGQVWRKPSLLLSLQYVQTEYGYRVDVEERDTPQGKGLATMSAGTALWAVGTYRVAEDRFPADFAMAVQHQMEAVFLAGITEQREQADRRESMAQTKLQRARVRDQRASTPTDPSEWDLAAARNRGGAWNARGSRGREGITDQRLSLPIPATVEVAPETPTDYYTPGAIT